MTPTKPQHPEALLSTANRLAAAAALDRLASALGTITIGAGVGAAVGVVDFGVIGQSMLAIALGAALAFGVRWAQIVAKGLAGRRQDPS
ncbi:MAG: hypothetical protein ACRDI1_02075 [Actinomycetota bacterium]